MPLHFITFAITRLFVVALILAGVLRAEAGSATWKGAPMTGNWNDPRNWVPRTVPNGPSDVASFSASNLTSLSITAATEVASIVFQPGASSFSISDVPTIGLTISGNGVENNSGLTQNFIAAPGDFDVGSFNFTNAASAGTLATFTLQGGTFSGQGGGVIQFFGNSTAGRGTFLINGAQDLEGGAGNLIFYDSSTASVGNFSLSAGVGPASALVQFRGTSTAGSGTFTDTSGVIYFLENANADSASINLNGAQNAEQAGGVLLMGDDALASEANIVGFGGAGEFLSGAGIFFFGNSNAANSHLIANGELADAGGATIYFEASATGGTCSVEINDRGALDISLHDSPGVTIGSLQGNGTVFLGANNLSVGSNSVDTIFAGIIQDGGINGGTSGSLTKIGSATLTLSGFNLYTGGTTVTGGTLLAITRGASATGFGPVQIEAGILAGTSKLSGAITLGTGGGPGAFISPGANSPSSLTTRGDLAFHSDSTYLCELSTSRRKADQIAARGVTIDNGALFSFTAIGHQSIPTGTVFIVINNSAQSPISGSFSNLPDGSTFTAGGNTFLVSYEGGTGNDLTLTVVE